MEEKDILKMKLSINFNKRYFSDKEVRRGLGFDKPQLNPEIKATMWVWWSDESFGHSGFTGAYTWG